jgi:hypothetical protein
MNKKWVKTVLSVLIVAVGGFILFNIGFLFNYVVSLGVDWLVNAIKMSGGEWVPTISHLIFLIILLGLSVPILLSHLPTLAKATYLTLPISYLLLSVGIFLYPSQILVYIVSGLLLAAILAYLWLRKKSWLYTYAALLTAAAMLLMVLTGTEI